jgi:hypothetical protein
VTLGGKRRHRRDGGNAVARAANRLWRNINQLRRRLRLSVAGLVMQTGT